MLNAHGIGTLTPAPEIFGCEEPLHFLDDVGLGETGLLLDLLEGDAVGPGGPNKPGIGADRRLGLLTRVWGRSLALRIVTLSSVQTCASPADLSR